MVRRTYKYNFSQAPASLTRHISSFLKNKDQYGQKAFNASWYCIKTKDMQHEAKLCVGEFILLIFGLIDVFGRTCKGDCDYQRSIKDAEALFQHFQNRIPVDFRTRVVMFENARCKFETYKREYGLAQSVVLESMASKKAVSSAAVMLAIPHYMTKGFSDTNVLNVYQHVMDVMNGRQQIPQGETEATEMLTRCYQHFVNGVFDTEMAEAEHYAIFVLRHVFSDQLEPEMWRKVNPFRPMLTSATETLSLDDFGHKGLDRQTYVSIATAMRAIEGSVGMAIHDAPWFMVHGNMTTFLPDQAQKVVYCGTEFAKCVVVATPEALALWRKRVLIASCKTSVDVVGDIHTIASAFWDDSVTRFWLINRLWNQTTKGTVAPREFLRPDHKHYEFFWCLLPVLARLDGKALASAIAVGGVRYLEPETARTVHAALKTSRKVLRTHRKALAALAKGGEQSPIGLYAMAMDARIDIEWRLQLVRLLTDSTAWQSTAKFTAVFVAKGVPLGQRYTHVSKDVAQAAVDIVSSLTSDVDVKREGCDTFAYPTFYNPEQNFVSLSNSLLIDAAYAYQSFETVKDELCVLSTQTPPRENHLIRDSLETLLDSFPKHNDTSRAVALQTPRTPSRPAFQSH